MSARVPRPSTARPLARPRARSPVQPSAHPCARPPVRRSFAHLPARPSIRPPIRSHFRLHARLSTCPPVRPCLRPCLELPLDDVRVGLPLKRSTLKPCLAKLCLHLRRGRRERGYRIRVPRQIEVTICAMLCMCLFFALHALLNSLARPLAGGGTSVPDP